MGKAHEFGVSLRNALSRSRAMDEDRLIARLQLQGPFPVIPERPAASAKALQYARIGDKIDSEYAKGNVTRAENWDKRLEQWAENKDSHLEGMDEGPEVAGGVPDSPTGISLQAAQDYADMLAGRLSPQDIPARLRDVSFGNLQGPATHPTLEDALEFAKQMHAERQALRARLTSPPPAGLRPLSLDELIDRLGR